MPTKFSKTLSLSSLLLAALVCFSPLNLRGQNQETQPKRPRPETRLNKQDPARTEKRPSAAPINRDAERPRLIVGIVVDQMRYDYLYRYQSQYGPDGFNRLLREGFSCENAHYNFVPTYTAPGHAAIYTGATPAVSGIISNEWFEPEWGKNRYVTEDSKVQSVGTTGKVGQHSPAVLLSTTITDELRLSNNFRSKVVGVCLKDRGGILPAGHFPNACYWFDDKTGNWITSTWYPDSLGLPAWVQKFNERKLAEQYLATPWTPLHPENGFPENFANWGQYEKRLESDADGALPHNLPALKAANGGLGLIRYTPFGNSFTLDFALEAIENMGLGTDEAPDFLCLSFSSTDYCGHQFGIHAEETEDTYLRLDLDIARLLNVLDQKIGKNNTLVFLTADHGGAETPMHLQHLGVPAGVLPSSKLDTALNSVVERAVGKKGKFVQSVGTQQVWLNHALMQSLGIAEETVAQVVAAQLRSLPGIYDAYTRKEFLALPADYPFIAELRRGYHPRRGGDVFFQLEPAWHPDDKFFGTGGTTHGTSYAYDTHVPLLWRGWRIRSGESFAAVNITDIAPTLAAMLRIMEPNGSSGKIIEGIWRH